MTEPYTNSAKFSVDLLSEKKENGSNIYFFNVSYNVVCNKVYIGAVVLKGRWYTDVRREPADRTWHLDTLIIENPGVFIQTEMRWWW